MQCRCRCREAGKGKAAPLLHVTCASAACGVLHAAGLQPELQCRLAAVPGTSYPERKASARIDRSPPAGRGEEIYSLSFTCSPSGERRRCVCVDRPDGRIGAAHGCSICMGMLGASCRVSCHGAVTNLTLTPVPCTTTSEYALLYCAGTMDHTFLSQPFRSHGRSYSASMSPCAFVQSIFS